MQAFEGEAAAEDATRARLRSRRCYRSLAEISPRRASPSMLAPRGLVPRVGSSGWGEGGLSRRSARSAATTYDLDKPGARPNAVVDPLRTVDTFVLPSGLSASSLASAPRVVHHRRLL